MSRISSGLTPVENKKRDAGFLAIFAVLWGLGTYIAMFGYLFHSAGKADFSEHGNPWLVGGICFAIFLAPTVLGAMLFGRAWPGTPTRFAILASIPHLIPAFLLVTDNHLPVGIVFTILAFFIYRQVTRYYQKRAIPVVA